MPPVTVSTDIDRPASEVFAYATDPTRFHEWQQGVVSGTHTPARPDGTPERCLTVRRIGFADRPNTSDVVESQPPRTWRIRGIDGPIRAQVEVEVDELATDRSRLTISVDFTGHGIGKLLVPLAVLPQARKEMPANIAALKSRLEPQPTS